MIASYRMFPGYRVVVLAGSVFGVVVITTVLVFWAREGLPVPTPLLALRVRSGYAGFAEAVRAAAPQAEVKINLSARLADRLWGYDSFRRGRPGR